MAFRVLLIESEVYVHLKLNNLVIEKEGNDIWIPLDDISVIVLDNLSVNITARMMSVLADKGIELIVCNMEHLPIGSFGAYDNHSRASKILGFQINNEQKFYDDLWVQIVKAKINNQKNVLKIIQKEAEIICKLEQLKNDVLSGDPTNREAHAAKIYFNTMMNSTFSRGNDNILLNSGLDYGYSIIRSYISRLCVGYGLNTQIGIHHKNEYNRFNLVDDLMEPIRPFVDLLSYRLLDGEKYFKQEHRRKLVNIVNNKVLYNNKNMYIGNMLERYVEQAAAYISGKNIEIEFPNVENYEIEGGYEV